MNLEKYIELSGETVAPSQEAKVKAAIRRTKSKLEAMLGYSLKPQNLYTERGKVQFQGYLPILNNHDNLLPPDDAKGDIKLFPYNEADRFLFVDPYRNLYRAKLVMPINDQEFITIVDLDNVVARYSRNNVGKYIEKHYEWFLWEWYRTWLISFDHARDAGLMLAVDADWIECYPDDLMYIWADMVTYQTSDVAGLSSESVDGHSWSRTKEDQIPPQLRDGNFKIIKQYAGPFGTVNRVPTT